MTMADIQRLHGRVVLITGASSGIGRATALRLARAGARLVLVARSADELEDVVRECRSVAASSLPVVADVADPGDVERAMQAAETEFGGLDAVVHSAGVAGYGRLEQIPAEVFDAVVRSTFTGTVTVLRAAVQRFRARREGRIVVLGSVLGQIAVPQMSPYVASKWGVHGLVRSTQQELRDEPDVHLSLISPAGVDTPIYTRAATYLGRHGRPVPPVRSADSVAAQVVRALVAPRREIRGITSSALVAAFRLAPAAFDAVAGPALRAVGMSRRDGVPPTPGNAFVPIRQEPVAQVPPADGVPQVSRRVDASAEAVWRVLADGWQYATWVVGASRMRAVDDTWPEPGSRLHHSVGLWPLVVDDVTEVLAAAACRELVLQARGWPLGEARVRITLTPGDPADGSPTCTVTLSEDATTGPGRLVPRVVRQPVIRLRNVEALRRLALLAEGRRSTAAPSSAPSAAPSGAPSAGNGITPTAAAEPTPSG
ncbi:MAG: SDR family NAD(P)-dependent oxidoreductase [Kineosporiaceae bacterium]|nr:SDR family NAD(P)-dependent oxidoreductase [Kineosporiaceae bacterium]